MHSTEAHSEPSFKSLKLTFLKRLTARTESKLSFSFLLKCRYVSHFVHCVSWAQLNSVWVHSKSSGGQSISLEKKKLPSETGIPSAVG